MNILEKYLYGEWRIKQKENKRKKKKEKQKTNINRCLGLWNRFEKQLSFDFNEKTTAVAVVVVVAASEQYKNSLHV